MEDGATAPTMRNQAPLLLVSISYWINPSYFPILNVKVEPLKFPFLIILLNVSFFFSSGLAFETLAGVISLAPSEIDQSLVSEIFGALD